MNVMSLVDVIPTAWPHSRLGYIVTALATEHLSRWRGGHRVPELVLSAPQASVTFFLKVMKTITISVTNKQQ